MTVTRDDALLDVLRDIYRDLHAHPELSSTEHRTASIAAAWLRERGFAVTEAVGGTGVVGVLRNGDGPVVALRADMDGLPVAEATGLAYASTARGTDPEGVDVPLMHACGHDMHVTCLLGASHVLARSQQDWRGTVVVVFQPAEETASGAKAMVADGLLDLVPAPTVLLGQHVSPLPAGTIGLRPGASFAATDSLKVVIHGRGGHGSRPETTVDPVLLAAATVLRLHTVVSREVAATDTAVLSIGSIRSGLKANVIPDDAELLLNVRSYRGEVRDRILASITRVVEGEAAAAGAPRPPEVTSFESSPTLENDPAAVARTVPVLESVVGVGHVVDPGAVSGSEDVQVLSTAAGAPLVFWLLGGADPHLYAGAATLEEMLEVLARIPSNHSPHYAPVIDPTLAVGVDALVAAARAWLAAPDDAAGPGASPLGP